MLAFLFGVFVVFGVRSSLQQCLVLEQTTPLLQTFGDFFALPSAAVSYFSLHICETTASISFENNEKWSSFKATSVTRQSGNSLNGLQVVFHGTICQETQSRMIQEFRLNCLRRSPSQNQTSEFILNESKSSRCHHVVDIFTSKACSSRGLLEEPAEVEEEPTGEEENKGGEEDRVEEDRVEEEHEESVGEENIAIIEEEGDASEVPEEAVEGEEKAAAEEEKNQEMEEEELNVPAEQETSKPKPAEEEETVHSTSRDDSHPSHPGLGGEFGCFVPLLDYEDMSEHLFDLTPLERVVLRGISPRNSSLTYEMNLCGTIEESCGDLGLGMIYEYYKGDCVSVIATWGDVSPKWDAFDSSDYDKGVRLRLHGNGNGNGGECGDVSEMTYNVDINLKCDASAKINSDSDSDEESFYVSQISESCHYAVDVYSEYACPLGSTSGSEGKEGLSSFSPAALFFLLMFIFLSFAYLLMCGYKYSQGKRGWEIFPFYQSCKASNCCFCPKNPRTYSKVNINDSSGGGDRRRYGTAQMSRVRQHFSL